MVRNVAPKKSLFNLGITSIRRLPNESQAEFDATKGDAKYNFKGDTHTLTLDGKTDDVVMSQLYNGGDNFITNLEQLRGKNDEILSACKASEDMAADLEDMEVDFGTGSPWVAFPDYDKNYEVIGHTLIPSNLGRSHKISVSQKEDGVRLTVKTETPDSSPLSGAGDLTHSMSGMFTNDGQMVADFESMGYRGPK